jgi:hypothetical protein
VASQHGVQFVDQDGIGEPELFNARRDLADLLFSPEKDSVIT